MEQGDRPPGGRPFLGGGCRVRLSCLSRRPVAARRTSAPDIRAGRPPPDPPSAVCARVVSGVGVGLYTSSLPFLFDSSRLGRAAPRVDPRLVGERPARGAPPSFHSRGWRTPCQWGSLPLCASPHFRPLPHFHSRFRSLPITSSCRRDQDRGRVLTGAPRGATRAESAFDGRQAGRGTLGACAVPCDARRA